MLRSFCWSRFFSERSSQRCKPTQRRAQACQLQRSPTQQVRQRRSVVAASSRLRCTKCSILSDRTNRAGGAGVDNITPKQFAADLDANLDKIREQLQEGSYTFARLKPFFIQKPGSKKERVICVPTVQDRIVQKAIVHYLASTRKLPIYNSSSFGFIKGTGTKEAIQKAVELRSLYDWCIKADIEAFFDRISRPYLKERASAVLKNHSLLPIILSAIDCEIRTKPAI